ncbi:hypothetical protein ACFSHR_04385 [Azotobacter chroococcum]
MPAAARRLALLALGCLLVTGCAGFRGGWESVAYLGDTPPALRESPSFFEETQNPPALELPSLRLQVTLDNQLRTGTRSCTCSSSRSTSTRASATGRTTAPGKPVCSSR